MDAQQKLLEKYAPTLVFAEGERFFPMDVNSYLKECKLFKHNSEHHKNVDVTRQWDERKNELIQAGVKEETARGEALKYFDHTHYLQLVQPDKWGQGIRIITFLALVILVVILWSNLRADEFSRLLQQFNPGWPLLWREPWDTIRFIPTAVGILAWPWLRSNQRVHLGLVIFLAATFFFGTLLGTGIGMIAFALCAFFLLYYSLYPIVSKKIEKTSLIRIIFIFLTSIPILTLLYLLDSVLGFNYVEKINLWVFHFKLSAFIAVSLIYSVAMVFVFSWVGRKLSNLITANFPEKITIDELRDFLILIIAFLFVAPIIAIEAGFAKNFIFVDDFILYIIALITIGAAIFALFEDPLELLEEFETGGGNSVHSSSIRAFWITIFGFLSYLLLSLTINVFQLPWIADFIFMSIDPAIIPDLLVFITIAYLLIFVLILFVSIGLLGSALVGFVMALNSLQPDSVSDRASQKFPKHEGEKISGHYYGHVLSDDAGWTTLQYHYFYGFNDWRKANGGVNHHEGDWEAVAIFLRDENPIAAAYSQHHNGKLYKWDKLDFENGTQHPKVYVARGSHANYAHPETYPASMFFYGKLRPFVDLINKVLGYFKGAENGLPFEDANGGKKKINSWSHETIGDHSHGWVEYQGLWGRKHHHKDESGPSGPKYNIPVPPASCIKPGEMRYRWKLHDWKIILLFDLIKENEHQQGDDRSQGSEWAQKELSLHSANFLVSTLPEYFKPSS